MVSFKSILRFLACIEQECVAYVMAVQAHKKSAAYDGHALKPESITKGEYLIAPASIVYVTGTLKDICSEKLQITRGLRITLLLSPVSI